MSHQQRTVETAVLDTLTHLPSAPESTQPKAFGCTAGMQFFWMNSAPNYASVDGDNHYTNALVKNVFIAANRLNQLITFIPELTAA